MTSCLQPGDVAARLGGDEFAVIQFSLAHADEAEMFARRICRAASIAYGTRPSIEVGVSIGTCTGQALHDSFDDLLSVADQRMYVVRRSGGEVYGSTASSRLNVNS